jgi:arylsulfatase A-like enzyme
MLSARVSPLIYLHQLSESMKTIFFSFFLLLLVLPACAEQTDTRTNLLVIMTDQQRFDALSAAGNSVLETPNIDRIANEGVLFENAYTPVPVCAPARTSILSGQSIDNTGIDRNTPVYTPEAYRGGASFDMLLSEAGYKTGYYGKWHSPQELAARYDNTDDYPVTATSGNAGLGIGMSEFYRNYLDAAGVPGFRSADRYDLPEGQLVDTYSRRPYELNPMDKRFGLSMEEVGAMEKISQGDIHGTLQIDTAHSITAMEARGVLDAIDRFADEPFSLTVSFHYPHPPYTPAEPYASLYPPDEMPLPESISDDREQSPYKEANRNYESPRYSDPEKVRHFIATYYGLVKEIDDWVGKILDKLDEHGLAESTLVVFVSDHGEMLGSHGMTSKNIFYEESVRVPFLMRLPGAIAAGTRVDDPVSTRDIFPTVLDYLGQPPREGIDSESLRGVIDGTEERDFAIAEWRADSKVPTYMVRSGEWKLLISKLPDAKSIDALYNLEADPHEMHNLLFEGMPESHALVAADLKSKLISWLEDANSPAVRGVRDRQLPAAASP